VPDDRQQKKPRLTSDERVPGSFEGETLTRRRFMTGTVHTAGAVATAAFVLPALGFAIAPVFDEVPVRWESVGPVGNFPDNTYIPRTITISPGIGDVGKSQVYVRKYNPDIDSVPEDQYSHYIAISTRCMHLGCPVRFVEASARFICPCHGGVYDFEGKHTGGPPVRPLDRFYTRVRNGDVEIGPRFSVNSELHRFSPRDPGQPLDGIGQYLYPARPSTRKLPGT